MKRDEAERNLMEAEARVMQLRNAGADSNPALSGEMQEAMRVMADCELNVDVASDELQRCQLIYTSLFCFFLDKKILRSHSLALFLPVVSLVSS